MLSIADIGLTLYFKNIFTNLQALNFISSETKQVDERLEFKYACAIHATFLSITINKTLDTDMHLLRSL